MGRAGPPRPRLRDAAHLAAAGRRLPARRRLHHGGAPLRSARQPARAEELRRCARYLREELPRLSRVARRAGPRADRLRRLPGRGRRHRVAGPAASAAIRARRGDRSSLGRRAAGDLPSEPPEHPDGAAHLADVRGRLRRGARSPRARARQPEAGGPVAASQSPRTTRAPPVDREDGERLVEPHDAEQRPDERLDVQVDRRARRGNSLERPVPDEIAERR